MKKWFKAHPKTVIAILFFICVLVAFMARTYHYNEAAYKLNSVIGDVRDMDPKPGFFRSLFPYYHKNFVPFTIESALMFSYAEDIANGNGVPKSDPSLLGQEDLAPYEQMVMGLEWFLGWGYKIKSVVFPDPAPTPDELRFQDNPRMAQWMSTQIRFWMSLCAGLIFLWLIVLKCPKWLALFGGLLYALSPAGIARATGFILVRGDFAMPFLLASIVLAYAIYIRPARWKYLLFIFSSFMAMAVWDLSQMFFVLWALFEILRFLLGGKITDARRNVWVIVFVTVALNAFFVPFHRAYSLMLSPLLLVILPTLMFILYFGRNRNAVQRIGMALVLPLCLYAAWYFLICTPEYVSNYSHFTEMMKAKIHFGNVKPVDPALLTYDARIMWTPAMHSATWNILVNYFPSLFMGGLDVKANALKFVLNYLPFTLTFFYLLLILSSLFTVTRRAVLRESARSLFPVLLTVFFTVGFIYIVRYHEFLIIFLAASLPLIVQDVLRALRCRKPVKGEADYQKIRSRRKLTSALRFILVFLCMLSLYVELAASEVLSRRDSERQPSQEYRATARLIEWFRRSESMKGKGVMADFSLGPVLKAYCSTSMPLNPQFGLERIRRPTQTYYETLFHGDEQKFAEFCNNLNTEYFVFHKGLTSSLSIKNLASGRYIANAVDIRGTAPANLMYYYPNRLSWFFPIDPPPDLRPAISPYYTVFRVIAPAQKLEAIRMSALGEVAFEEWGDEHYARRCVLYAITLDPTLEEARLLFFKLFKRYPKITLDGIE